MALSLPARTLYVRQYRGAVGLARFGAIAGLRVAGWATTTAVRQTTDVVREIGSGAPLNQIVDARLEVARSTMWRFLRVDRTVRLATPTYTVTRLRADPGTRDLRERGDALLRRIGDPNVTVPDGHPAFARMLDDLLPDEARILRFLAVSGPQPAIDIRMKVLRGDSQVIAVGINLVADMAGATYPDRNQHYLANLIRLGLVRYSEDQVDDPRRYSFLEAQPGATAAMTQGKRTHSVYRSIVITAFGRQFCQACFTLDGYDAGGWAHDQR